MAFPTLYFVQRIHLWIKSKKGKAKGTWNSPSPDYYQTSVMKVLHRFTVTRSNFKNKEESPYKPEKFGLAHNLRG
jgi:hypothetical protein